VTIAKIEKEQPRSILLQNGITAKIVSTKSAKAQRFAQLCARHYPWPLRHYSKYLAELTVEGSEVTLAFSSNIRGLNQIRKIVKNHSLNELLTCVTFVIYNNVFYQPFSETGRKIITAIKQKANINVHFLLAS